MPCNMIQPLWRAATTRLSTNRQPCSEPKDVMDPIPEPILSVGCLLYLAANRVVAPRRRMLFTRTQVPCKRVWVDPIDLSAVVLAATFLSLQEGGHLSFRIHEKSLRIIPAGVMPSMTLYAEVLDTTSRPGLAGALLSAAINSPDGRVGTADGEPGHMFGRDESHVLGLLVKHPYVREVIELELARASAYTPSRRGLRPDCARIALLEAACADAVRWWKRQQADGPRLCTLLLDLCRTASLGPIGGGG